MNDTQKIEHILALTLLVLLVIGTYLVLRPFTAALLWSVLLCYATWPVFLRLKAWLKHRPNLAALALCLTLTAVLVLPFLIVGMSLADNVSRLSTAVREMLAQGLPAPPDWVAGLPLFGERLHAYWLTAATDTSTLIEPIKRALPDISKWLLGHGVAIGNGVLQLTFSVFILFFLYRDGEVLAERLNNAMDRIGGARASALLRLAGNTVKGVVYGILGTALAQGILAGFGFFIAGVPGALLLGLGTFFLSLIPMGPPLIWLPVAVWTYYQGDVGWAIFLVIWGAAVVSSVDNFLKPYLISQGAAMPFILVLLGVLGGLAAFGFVGVFLGPIILAIAYSLVRDWTIKVAADSSTQS